MFDIIVFFGDVGIKFWVFMGDKVEIVINIGFFCNLFNNDMEFIYFKVEVDESFMNIDEEFLL